LFAHVRVGEPASIPDWTREKCVKIFAHKNTGDLQGGNLRKYNMSHCNREKKSNRPETGKNRREKQAETIQKQGTALLAATKNPPMSSGGRQIAQIGD
jgi:hypothetical protein